MGGWAVAQSPILRTTVTIKRLKMKGYVSSIEYYSISNIIEQPYTACPPLEEDPFGLY